MRRFTDPVLFAALLVLDLIAWAVVVATSSTTTADPSRLAPMTVGSVVVIAAPALAVVVLLSLARALAKAAPRTFYGWALLTSVVSALVSGGASALTSTQGIQVGLGWMTWFFAVESLAYVVALVLALTGAIPVAGEETPAAPATASHAPTPMPVEADDTPASASLPGTTSPEALPPSVPTPEGDVAE